MTLKDGVDSLQSIFQATGCFVQFLMAVSVIVDTERAMARSFFGSLMALC